MPRPTRCRRIGRMPEFRCFSPDDAPGAEAVRLTLDEYETLRLLDLEGLTQEACAQEMGVARTTVTGIYESARRKTAEALVRGRRLLIGGGCCRVDTGPAPKNLKEKGRGQMRIAIPYENGEIFQHFGRTERFRLYDAENGAIVSAQTVETNGSGHGALAGFLRAAGVDALVCGVIGAGAQMALAEAGIRLHAGVTGGADEAAQALAAGTLSWDPDARCGHHDHHGAEGSCGGKGCAGHEGGSCGGTCPR